LTAFDRQALSPSEVSFVPERFDSRYRQLAFAALIEALAVSSVSLNQRYGSIKR
jgi:hypothetical protein